MFPLTITVNSNPTNYPRNERYYGSNCRVCFSSDNLRFCGLCQTVAYCSLQHLHSDWVTHHNLCRVLRAARSRITYNIGCSFEEWTQYRIALKKQLRIYLDRELSLYETEICHFPAVCSVCYMPTNLINCEFCHSVTYCCVEHMVLDYGDHKLYCAKLSSAKLFYFAFFGRMSRITPFTMRTIPENMFVFPIDYVELIRLVQNTYGYSENRVNFVTLGDEVAPIGSIIYALEKIKVIQQRYYEGKPKTMFRNRPRMLHLHRIGYGADYDSPSKLVIHFVGATEFEMSSLQHIVYLLTGWRGWVLNIDFIEIILTGADLVPRMVSDTFSSQNYRLIGASITTHITTYRHVVNHVTRPDVVVAFQADKNFERNQLVSTNSLRDLVKYPNVPLILTGCEEVKLNCIVNKMKCMNGVNVKLRVGKNPFANRRPVRIWDKPYIYAVQKNDYITVLMKELLGDIQ